MINRRTSLKLLGATAAAATARINAAAPAAPASRWVSTSITEAWRSLPVPALTPMTADLFSMDVQVEIDKPAQTIQGFGGAFTEKGWQALSHLSPALRNKAVAALFSPEEAAFNLCRTPIGANDISRKWYSYDEVDGDFDMAHFSIDNDKETLIPFINAAQIYAPKLKLWASPWSPPTWMKKGKHYAQATAWPGQPSNGIKPEQMGTEGKDSFILEDKYLEAYARYFRRYVEEYGKAGIPISMVMPQNEFNSAQPFPSCCWTPQGLARFIPFLGKEMGKLGVEIFFGTLERGNADLLDAVMKDPAAAAYIKGVGVQWAGKGALSHIQERHPNLPLYASEQECGMGQNDWHYPRYIWGEMKQYFNAGAVAWEYWNLVMPEDGMSGWGWKQNALITVDRPRGTFHLNHEYYLMRHFSGFIKAGAVRIPTSSFSGFENQLAFRNPDGQLIIIVQNEMAQEQVVRMVIGGKILSLNLPADSFNTIAV